MAARKHKDFLQLLAHCPKTQRNAILKTATKNQLVSICEVCKNVLNGKIPLTRVQKQKLHAHRIGLRLLADKSTPLARKRVILQKGGGFLGPLLALAAPIISKLF